MARPVVNVAPNTSFDSDDPGRRKMGPTYFPVTDYDRTTHGIYGGRSTRGFMMMGHDRAVGLCDAGRKGRMNFGGFSLRTERSRTGLVNAGIPFTEDDGTESITAIWPIRRLALWV